MKETLSKFSAFIQETQIGAPPRPACALSVTRAPPPGRQSHEAPPHTPLRPPRAVSPWLWPAAEPAALTSAGDRGRIPKQFRQTHWWEASKALSCSEESKGLAGSQTPELSIL